MYIDDTLTLHRSDLTLHDNSHFFMLPSIILFLLRFTELLFKNILNVQFYDDETYMTEFILSYLVILINVNEDKLKKLYR